MSLKNELEGIKTKLQNILNRSNTELTAKGATTVPSLNGLPEAIKSIVTGGGGGADVSPFKSLEIKTWTPATDTMYYQVEKTANLGMIIMFCNGAEVGRNGIHTLSCVVDSNKIEQYGYPVGSWSGMAYGNASGLATYNYPNAGQIGDDNGATGFRTGATYTVMLFYN